jgi:hypothetical protein
MEVYNTIQEPISNLLKNWGVTKETAHEVISRVTAASGLPVMASGLVIAKHFGFTEELSKCLFSFQKFYRYDFILGIEPYLNLPDCPEFLHNLKVKT